MMEREMDGYGKELAMMDLLVSSQLKGCYLLHSYKKAGIKLRRRTGGRVGCRDPEGGDC